MFRRSFIIYWVREDVRLFWNAKPDHHPPISTFVDIQGNVIALWIELFFRRFLAFSIVLKCAIISRPWRTRGRPPLLGKGVSPTSFAERGSAPPLRTRGKPPICGQGVSPPFVEKWSIKSFFYILPYRGTTTLPGAKLCYLSFCLI